jgi:ADP-ribose pyrophosphatase YjhB (NUDIX family)
MPGTVQRAAVAIVELEGRDEILCVWNRKYETWSLPGGKVEPGETPAQACARELLEETGVSWDSGPEQDEEVYVGVSQTGSGRIVHVFGIYVEERESPRQVEEGSPVAWMSWRELLAVSKFRHFYLRMLSEMTVAVDGIAYEQARWMLLTDVAVAGLALLTRPKDPSSPLTEEGVFRAVKRARDYP